MTASAWPGVSSMRLERDGTISIFFTDGRVACSSLGREAFLPTSAVASSTFLPEPMQLKLQTTRGHDIILDLAQPPYLSPLNKRPVIYLDQNHWSTLTNTIYQPDRVKDKREQDAATQIISLAKAREVILPMSAAHLSETTKQVDRNQRYQRALTIAQLARGWQLRDPLALRRFELRQALTIRYRQRCLIPLAAITLEPNAIYSGRDSTPNSLGADLPPSARWTLHAIQCIGGIIDMLLDADHVPMTPNPGWTSSLQEFADFLRDNPTGKEMKRRRTHARFIADLGRELPEEAHQIGITTAEMSDWVLNYSEEDLSTMPALGFFREVLHEKLSDGRLRWEDNDLVDMMYLTAAAGYCDHVVGERAHIAYITNASRRLGRSNMCHRNLQSLVKQL